MAKIVINIRSFRDGTVMISSIPSMEEIAHRHQSMARLPLASETYALRIANHLTEYQSRRKVIAGTGETLVVLTVEDNAVGGVSVSSDPKAEDIYRRNRDQVSQISQAEVFALEAFTAVFAMSKAAAVNLQPTKR